MAVFVIALARSRCGSCSPVLPTHGLRTFLRRCTPSYAPVFGAEAYAFLASRAAALCVRVRERERERERERT
eukprot:5517208-Amphidinium_carterae.1